MPIVRQFTPAVGPLGALAFRSGLGQFKQRQDQFNLNAAMEVARFGLAAQDADRRFQFAQQDRAAQQQARQQAMEAQAYQAEQNRMAEAAQQQQDFQNRVALQQLTQQGQLDYIDAQAQAWGERDMNKLQAQQQFDQWQQMMGEPGDAGVAAAISSQADNAIAQINQMDLGDDLNAKRMRGRLLADYESLKKYERVLPPDSYADLAQEWLDRVQKADLGQYEKKPFNMDDLLSDKVRFINGRDLSDGAWVAESRNGELVPKFVPPPKKEEPKAAPQLIDDKPATMDSLEAAALKELLLSAKRPVEGKNPDGTPKYGEPTPPTTAEIEEKVVEIAKRRAKIAAALKTAAADSAEGAANAESGMQPIPTDPNAAGGFQQLPVDPREAMKAELLKLPPTTAATADDVKNAKPGPINFNGRQLLKYPDGSFDSLN